MLVIEHLEKIWKAATYGNKEGKSAIYKCLSDVSSSFNDEHLEFLLKNILQLDISTVSRDEIDLLNELTKFSISNKKLF